MTDLDNFLKESIKLIDTEDINRELNNCNYKYSKELLKKDLEIEKTIKKNDNINNLVNDMNEKNNILKIKLNKILDSLS